jgi:hypothetical protein
MDDDTVRLLIEQNAKLIEIISRNTAVDAIRAMNPPVSQSAGPDDANPYRDDSNPPALSAVGGTPGQTPGAEISAPADSDPWALPDVPLELLRAGNWADSEPTPHLPAEPPIYTEKPGQ